jgi:lysophospholipase L1-like esterase
MRTIVCYGDSNTWGYDPAQAARFDSGMRWPGVLQDELGENWRVIEEGLCGRTTVFDDPIEGIHKNGKTYLLPCLESHKPIDLVIIMLGTNDLKQRFGVPAGDIARGAGVLADIVLASGAGSGTESPQVLLVAPPPILEETGFGDMFNGAAAQSAQFAELYSQEAQLRSVHFLDAGSVISSSEADGIHLEASEHLKLGTVAAQKVREIFGESSDEE